MYHVIKAVVVGLALLPSVHGTATQPACMRNSTAYSAAYAAFIGEPLEGEAAVYAATHKGHARLGVDWLEALSQVSEDGYSVKGLAVVDVVYAYNAAKHCDIIY